MIHSIVNNVLGSLLIHRRIREHWMRYVYRVPTTHREIRFVLLRRQLCELIFAHSAIGLPEATKYFPTSESPLLNSRCQFSTINSVCPLVTSLLK
jgi:hypothetical protein